MPKFSLEDLEVIDLLSTFYAYAQTRCNLEADSTERLLERIRALETVVAGLIHLAASQGQYDTEVLRD